jgi:hypothetical protein
MKPIAFLIATVAALSSADAGAQASGGFLPDDVRATIGVRMWRTDWSSWFGDGSTYLHAGLQTSVIPVASIRYKDFLVSGSVLIKEKFVFPPESGSFPADRKEYDVNVGYFILPGLAATVGYKEVSYDAGGYEWKAKGLTLGVSGSAPLAPWTSLYGNIAYGRPKLRDTQFAFDGARGKYLLTEFGLAFPLGAVSPSMQGFVVTAGYRYQRIGAFPNGPATGFPPRELFETTQGPVLGISYSF